MFSQGLYEQAVKDKWRFADDAFSLVYFIYSRDNEASLTFLYPPKEMDSDYSHKLHDIRIIHYFWAYVYRNLTFPDKFYKLQASNLTLISPVCHIRKRAVVPR